VSGRPAIFLDRDGVLIENRDDYVLAWDDVVWLPGAREALAQLRDAPFAVVIVTNQSAVGRRLITPQAAAGINARLVEAIRAAGGRIDGVYLCPHTDADGCDCRKPAPGLLLRAAAELDLDLERSLLIGDALSDIIAARAAGVGWAALVRTGRGRAQERLPQAAGLQPLSVFDSLPDALAALTTTATR
jgi:D-glycero-D-manno-heptose 1,7-bisphosphate phosphatase